ncbi:COX15/CtaA family protein [Candidatus Poseidoniales archaeon]|nr:COX15/CtaA family protein [Candidatus Poseidoniales archaeon]
MQSAWWRRPSTLPLMMLVFAILIISFGGAIRIHDAGESCPDWPKCFGTYGFDISEAEQEAYWEENPDEIDSRGIEHRYTVFEIFLEWFHRFLVGVIAVPVLLNLYVSKKGIDKYGKNNFYSSVFISVMLLIQAIAGAVTVFYDNADWSVALHLSLASIFTAAILWQYKLTRVVEGANWSFIKASTKFVDNYQKKFDLIAISVLILLVLGAWVSSTAGGQYNQSCSVGFPDAWPQCNGEVLPSLDNSGILVQMIHRIGALLVGIILLMSLLKLNQQKEDYDNAEPYYKAMLLTTIFWFSNLLIGASYLIKAEIGEFPEWISLLHLLGGVTTFLVAASGPMMFRLTQYKDVDCDE